MIQVTFYNNGVKVAGHSRPDICSEVSVLTWACANSIWRLDDTNKYYTSINDNKENPHEGLTLMTFDKTNEKAKWLYDEYKHNLKFWAEGMTGDGSWPKDAVQITEVNDDFTYTSPH